MTLPQHPLEKALPIAYPVKDDDDHKAFCERELDVSNDKKKELQGSIAGLESQISDAEEQVSALTDEVATLTEAIKELDKSVADATEQRKEENAEYVQSKTELGAAVLAASEVLEAAIE